MIVLSQLKSMHSRSSTFSINNMYIRLEQKFVFCNFKGKIANLLTFLEMVGKRLSSNKNMRKAYTKETIYGYVYCEIILTRYEHGTDISAILNYIA